jgi:hypothetical protein
MNEFQSVENNGLLKDDYGAKNPTEIALKKRRKSLYDTKMGENAPEELIEETEDDV